MSSHFGKYNLYNCTSKSLKNQLSVFSVWTDTVSFQQRRIQFAWNLLKTYETVSWLSNQFKKSRPHLGPGFFRLEGPGLEPICSMRARPHWLLNFPNLHSQRYIQEISKLHTKKRRRPPEWVVFLLAERTVSHFPDWKDTLAVDKCPWREV